MLRDAHVDRESGDDVQSADPAAESSKGGRFLPDAHFREEDPGVLVAGICQGGGDACCEVCAFYLGLELIDVGGLGETYRRRSCPLCWLA